MANSAYLEQARGMWGQDSDPVADERARKVRNAMRLARLYGVAMRKQARAVSPGNFTEWHKRSVYYYCRLQQAVRDMGGM